MNTYMPEGLLLSSAQNREFLFGRQGIERAMAQGAILESTALLCDSQMNLHVDLHGIVGIIPKDEVMYCRDGEKIKDIAVITRVGKPVCFKVMNIYERGGKKYATLSRRQAQIECMRNYISDLIPGDIVDARITHLESFGAFVDIGCGIISLLSVDCISVSRISHPSDRLYVGMNIKAVIKSIDEDTGRIFVSMRELLGTWEENAAMFSPGQTVAGIIRSVEEYGVFVELTPNLAGLAELREDMVNSDAAKHLYSGKMAAVYIKSIIPERMKIKLVLIDSYKGETQNTRLKYFTDTDRILHIDRWRYSPGKCNRVIETVFE
ncbi:MAG: 30S ribosomal protein S1 [Ruminococcaceae bacterium]|nr:30S ribosomal protein S1 [Oscillospiraceae bacterium]